MRSAVVPKGAQSEFAGRAVAAYAARVKSPLLRAGLVLFVLAVGPAGARAQQADAKSTQQFIEEVPIGFLPIEWVNAAVRKTLSPQSRAALTSPTGPLRITDTAERLELLKKTLLTFQRAPALVPIELSFAARAQRTVQRLPAEQPVSDRAIPVPDRYDPPRIIAGAGGVTVVPAHPRSFTTRRVGPGATVNLNPTGYTTGEAEVRLSETGAVTLGARSFVISGVIGKPSTIPVLRQVPDPAALRELALQRGAIPNTEPAWTAAATELLVTPEISGGALVVNVVPQIVLPPPAAGQPPRRIPLPACAAAVLAARGAPPSTGLLPKTDPEFYRTFLGLAQATDETFTSLTVKADVQYLGNPPP